jgi:hypothetical protein
LGDRLTPLFFGGVLPLQRTTLLIGADMSEEPEKTLHESGDEEDEPVDALDPSAPADGATGLVD